MAAAAGAASTSTCCPDLSSVAHRRRLADVERDDDLDFGGGGGGGRHRGVRALFSVRRSYSSSKRASSVVDQAWVRNAVASLLGLAVVVGLLSSHRVGGGGGRPLVRRMDARDGQEALGWREENLTALARLSSPDDTPMQRRVPCVCTQEYLRSFLAGVDSLHRRSCPVCILAVESKPSTEYFSKFPSKKVYLSGAAFPSASLSANNKCLFFSSVVWSYTGILWHIAVSSFSWSNCYDWCWKIQ